MNLQRIKHMLFRLSTEEKVLGIGGLIVLISSFLPWYSVVLTYNEQANTESGFSGDLGVIGFVVFILVIMSLAFMLSEHFHIKLPHFGFKKEKIIMFLMSESAFLILLTLAIYTKRSIDYTNAELRFGLYLSLIGAFMATFSAYAQIQRLLKKNAQEFFDLPGDEPSGPETEPENDPPAQELPEEKPKHVEKHAKPATKHIQESFFEDHNSPKKESDEKIEESFFEEDVQEFTETEEEAGQEFAETKNIPEENIDLGINDDAIHDISKDINNTEEEKQLGQGSYFLKDAGVHKQPKIKVDIESIKPVEKKYTETPVAEVAEKNEPKTEKLDFYNDL